MAGYTKTEFSLSTNQKAERKLLVTCVNTGSADSQEWTVIGAGVEDSSVEYNADIETITDILGITETTVNKLEPSQSLEPMTIRGGNKVLFKLNDIVEEHPNANVYDVEYKPKEKIEEKTTIDPFTGW